MDVKNDLRNNSFLFFSQLPLQLRERNSGDSVLQSFFLTPGKDCCQLSSWAFSHPPTGCGIYTMGDMPPCSVINKHGPHDCLSVDAPLFVIFSFIMMSGKSNKNELLTEEEIIFIRY